MNTKSAFLNRVRDDKYCRQLFGVVMAAGALMLSQVVAASAAEAASSYTITDLGSLGGDTSEASAVNDSGEIIGFSDVPSGAPHAFSYTPSGGMVDLGTLGGSNSLAYAVNGSGEIVGESDTPSGEPHAFSYTPSGGMVDLGTLPGGLDSKAFGVNDSGEIVGFSEVPSGSGIFPHAFSYTSSGGMVDLGALPGDVESVAFGVSDNGEIVGYSRRFGLGEQAFSYTPSGGMIGLGSLAGTGSLAYSPGSHATCGVPEVCLACELQRCTGSAAGMMISHVPPSALSDLHPGLRLAGPARPLIGVEERGTAGAAAGSSTNTSEPRRSPVGYQKSA